MSISGITELLWISRNVANLTASTAFYCERLGFVAAGPATPLSSAAASSMGLAERAIQTQRLRFGNEILELVEVGPDALPYPASRSAADLWFQHFALRVTDIAAAYRRLWRSGCNAALPEGISRDAGGNSNPVSLPARSGGATAYKFRDPDGHPLELLQLPFQSNQLPTAGGGKHAHPVPTEGIDHSAISVSRVETSLAFYTESLGLHLGARQINRGQEQCELDSLANDSVDVVALMPAPVSSPHLELLAYRTPPGQALTTPLEPGDIAADRLVFAVAGLAEILQRLPEQAIVGGARPIIGHAGNQSALVRDPDGHLLLLTQALGAGQPAFGVSACFSASAYN